MDPQIIVRAWKDPEFRAQLSPEERSKLPENPSGKAFTELDESELDDAIGGRIPQSLDGLCTVETFGICPTSTVLSRRFCPTSTQPL